MGIHSLIFDDGEVIQLLRAAIEREGTQDAFARRHGIDNRAPTDSSTSSQSYCCFCTAMGGIEIISSTALLIGIWAVALILLFLL